MNILLRPSLFWDTNVTLLDFQKDKSAIIERVVSRGRWSEFKAILSYYGPEVVKNTLLQARYLDKYTLAFCSHYFNTPKNEFRCYKQEQLNPELWKY